MVYHNYNDDEEFIVNNAYITAEGALAYIIQNTYMSLSDINALVLGYGRVGKEMCKALKSNNAYTAIVTSKAKSELSNEPIDKSYTLNELTEVIKHFDVIINTVPSIILKGEILDLIDKECFIIDLASKPGGLDFDAASSLGLKVMHALGIPGKVAPATAARYLKESIIKSLI